MKKVIALLAVTAFAMPAFAGFSVTGDWEGWSGNGAAMSEVTAGVWEVTLNGLDVGRHEFKVTDGTWSWNYPSANSWFITDGAGDITITFNTNTVADGWAPDVNRIGLNVDPGSWTAVGGFQGWDNANAGTAMTPMGGGLYMYEAAGLAAGDYEWKAVVTGSWDSISWDNRSVNTANMAFTIDAVNTAAELWVDALTGCVQVVYTPEPATLALLAMGGLVIIRRR